MKYAIFDSPLGKLTVSTDGNHITGLHIEGDRYFTTVPKDWQEDSSDPLLVQAGEELTEYFAGQRKAFDLPIALIGTDFQKQVWEALSKIPYGSTASYGKIAAEIGNPKAVRAVGSAIGRNPLCLIIPCHRVIAGNGGLGGYVSGLKHKEQILKIETF